MSTGADARSAIDRATTTLLIDQQQVISHCQVALIYAKRALEKKPVDCDPLELIERALDLIRKLDE